MLAAFSLVAPAIPLPALTVSKQLSDAAMPFEGHELPHAVPHAEHSAALDQWGDQWVKETQDNLEKQQQDMVKEQKRRAKEAAAKAEEEAKKEANSPEAKRAAAEAAKEAEKAAQAEAQMWEDEKAAAERGRALRNGDAHWQTDGQKCRVKLANCRDGKLTSGKKTVEQCRALQRPHTPHPTPHTPRPADLTHETCCAPSLSFAHWRGPVCCSLTSSTHLLTTPPTLRNRRHLPGVPRRGACAAEGGAHGGGDGGEAVQGHDGRR